MATPIRSMLTRVCIPSSARRLQVQGRLSSAPNQINQNDIGSWRQSIDVESIREFVKTCKIEDEILRENLSWASWYYKTMERSCYGVLSVYTAVVITCEVVVRSRKNDLQAGLICDL